MSIKEEANLYREMQEDLLIDMDMSGGLMLEFEKITPKNGAESKHTS